MKPKSNKQTKAIKREKALQALGENITSQLSAKRLVTEPVKVKDAVTIKEHESICDKARALATQNAQARANDAATQEQGFMDSLFPDRSQYVNHGDHTYTICGLKWLYSKTIYAHGFARVKPNLEILTDAPENEYRLVPIFPRYSCFITATNLIEFGNILLRRDKRVAFIDKTYPDTFWGNIRLWLAHH